MITKLQFIFALILTAGIKSALAQAPVISYPTPQVYTVGTATTALTPTNTGGAVSAPSIVTLPGGYNNLRGIAIDAARNVYLAETETNLVREITAGGGSILVLGSGFSQPAGIVVDAANNVYVTDFGNNAIKKIPAGNGGVVTITSGLAGPYGIAINAAGDLYFSEFSAGDVKKIPAGTTTPVIVASGFNNPTGVAVDASGNLYVADRGNNVIKKVLASNGSAVTLSAGNGNIDGVTLDAAGNVYFADTNSTTITEIPVNGGNNIAVGSGFNAPACSVMDANGNLFVCEYSLVKEVTAGGYSISPALPAGLSFNTITGVISGTPTAVASAANYTVTAKNSVGSGNAIINITVKLPAKPVIVYATPEVYIADEAISPLSPGTSGGPIPPTGAFSVNPALPSGLNINVNTGVISGTPLDSGPAINYTVTATNAGGTGTAVISIKINAPSKPAISYISPQVYTATEAISPISPTTTGGPIPPARAFSVSPALPSGLSIDVNTGVISGTPSAASPATNYTVTATNAAGSGTFVINITVNAFPKPIISYATPQVYTADVAITAISPTSSGGAIPSSGAFSINPVLPAGLSFDINTGTISGTPTSTSAATNYTVTATNAGGGGTTIINITVDPFATPTLSYSTPKSYPLSFAITPLSPSAANVGAAGSNIITTIDSGLINFTGVAVDAVGNVYIAEDGNNAVRKIFASTGAVVTLGSGFHSPTGVAVDAAANVYVVDNGSNTIKKIPAGNGPVVTVASGFNGPYGIAIDTAGNLYVGDANNNQVKKIPAGTNTPVVIGSGFNHPTGVAVDAAGNVYVADRAGNAIKKILATNGSTTVLSAGDGNPNGVAIDASGNVYFADTNNGSITEIPAAGGGNIQIGSGFSNTIAVAVSTANPGTIYVGSNGNGLVEKVTPTGGYYISPALPAGLSFSSSTGVISGTPSVVSPATNYKVTAYNIGGGGSATVNISVYEADSGLANLTASSGTLSPVFATAVNNYTVNESSTTSSITITPTASLASNTITVNGSAVTSGNASKSISLSVGSNIITVIVKSSAGKIIGDYTVTAIRAPSSNAALAGLSVSAGTLNPVFSGTVSNYAVKVSDAINSFSVTPIVADATATVTVDNQPVASGSVSPPVPLSEGTNIISVVVTAQDGTTTKTYTITVTRSSGTANANLSALKISRGTLTPVFATATTAYTASVANGVASMTITPTSADPAGTITVNGVTVASGSASQSIPLVAGANTITAVVTASDGVTTKTYALVVTEAKSSNDNLSGLKPSTGALSPAFSAATTSYTESVANTVTSITITPTTVVTTSTVKVRGTAVTSGTASATIALAVGANTINTIVTAQDGTTKTYTITVTRATPPNATLSAYVINAGTLTPAFAAATTSYTASVAITVTSITVTPTVSDPTATVKVRGNVVTSGTASAPIALAVGANTINTIVTVPGATAKTYILTVTRAAANADSFNPGISVTKPAETVTLAEDGIQVHQGLSPNGDGVNDFLQIDNISQYPDNKLKIINRNGQLIFEAKSYDNSSKVFDGHSDKNGQMQLPGTYFYQLDYTVKGITRHKTGFLVLKY